MDDIELGALLDTTVPAAAPSDATLTRIHGRAAQRVRRARFAGAALVAVILAAGGATAAAFAGSANRGGPVSPAAPTFSIAGPGAPCPPGSLTLAIERSAPPGLQVTLMSWVVTVTGHTNLICRTHAFLEATIEKPDGRVINTISRNPLTPPDVYEDLFVPGRREAVAHLVLQVPCRDTPVRIVVGFEDHTSGRAVTIDVPKQDCARRDSDFPATGFLDPIVPGPSPTTTAAAP